MRHLVYMRTRVRVGVADGAIDVTSTVVGKVSELGEGEASLTLRSHAPEARAILFVTFTPVEVAQFDPER
jgi:hypothetical protein